MKIRYLKYVFGAIIITGGLFLLLNSSYSKIIKESYQKLVTYNVKTIDAEYGIMSYVDEGSGNAPSA